MLNTIEHFQSRVKSNPGSHWFCSTPLCDWSRKLTLFFQPIRCKTRTNHDLVAHVFPRFGQFGSFYFEFSLVQYSSLYSVGNDWSPPFPPENHVIRPPPPAIKNDWSIIQTNALNSMNLHKHYIPISLWATLRSPHRITGFLLSSSLRYSLKSLSQPWRYSSLNTNQSSFQLNVEKQNQINPSSQSEQRFISSLANENSKWTKWKNGNCLKRGKTRATKSRLFSALHLIGWEDGVSFLNQSQNKIQYLQRKPDHYRDSIKIPLML